ncbi:MAG TPA: ATP-binding protein [Polyangiaceae bacterium]|nr:ATP-binding protein [Polyangiaceae bacterium]
MARSQAWIFLWTLGAALSVFVGVFTYSDYERRNDAAEQLRAEAEVRARLIADRLASQSSELSNADLQRLTRALATASGTQIAIKARDGQVLATSGDPGATKSPAPLDGLEQQALGVGIASRVDEAKSAAEISASAAVPWLSGGAVTGVVRVETTRTSPDHGTTPLWPVLGALAIAGMAILVTRAMAPADATTAALVTLELENEKSRLKRVLSSMKEGVLLVDANGSVRLVNSALTSMLTVAEEPVGKEVSQVFDAPQLVELLRNPPGDEHQAVELVSRQNPARKILANARRLAGGDGVIAVFVDVTEQRRLETVRQEFVSNASHELRTPIAAILSAVETLQNIGAVTGDAEKNFMEMIGRNALRLKALVDDLLALSHVESGAVQVQPEPVKLKSAVEAIMNDLAAAASSRGTTLVCNVESDLVVMASPRGLHHVIGNLIDNAIKYCPPESRVTVEAHREAEVVAISVVDNGPGIPEAHRDRIFERFYRIDAGRSRGLGGTGLGLSIVKHWVEAMGGTIQVAAAPGGGTAFRVELGARKRAARSAARRLEVER